ncbi:hypothetical protein [Limosilactobacillus fermentum]|uniref:hypothetical protein n=1 Tax=Limosilactobacillus fermentum TaxID=1613 RepID=UPI0030052BCF
MKIRELADEINLAPYQVLLLAHAIEAGNLNYGTNAYLTQDEESLIQKAANKFMAKPLIELARDLDVPFYEVIMAGYDLHQAGAVGWNKWTMLSQKQVEAIKQQLDPLAHPAKSEDGGDHKAPRKEGNHNDQPAPDDQEGE